MSVRGETDGDSLHMQLAKRLAAARNGDAVAVEELVAFAAKFVYRRALVQVGRPHDAEEVVQEVMMKMLRRIDSLPQEGKRIAGWLHRVTRNAAIDRFRKRPPLERADAEVLAELAAPAETEPADRAGRQELVDLLLDFLGELPRRQREVFDLVELQGIAISDVASELRIRPSSVRGSLFKARRRLRQRMIAVWPGVEDER
ncbi:MAG: sigma-70 family RNA polymerase sigma factor [Gammaproteobacteria bacterium]|nr:sigma-70 family RNA polymerase sigma factor [Gammaproteobacteria bacterium]